MIPKIIHYTGPSKERWHPVWDICFESWIKTFPESEYKHIFWNDDDIESIIREDYPQYFEFYNNLPYHIMKVDFSRYAILHKHGGIYHDLDIYCYKNFYDNIKNYNCVLVEGLCEREFVQNSMMASESKDEYWTYLMDDVIRNFYFNPKDSNGEYSIEKGYYVLDTVSCLAMSRATLRYDKSVYVLPKNIYNPNILSYHKDYVTKHMLTGVWGKDDISDELGFNYKDYFSKLYSDFTDIDIKNFDFYKDYTGDSV